MKGSLLVRVAVSAMRIQLHDKESLIHVFIHSIHTIHHLYQSFHLYQPMMIFLPRLLVVRFVSLVVLFFRSHRSLVMKSGAPRGPRSTCSATPTSSIIL